MVKLTKILNILNSTKLNTDKHSIKQAIFSGDYELFKELLNNSYCDINAFDEEYRTLLDYAVLSRNIDIIAFLLARKAKLGTLFYSIHEEEDFIEKVEDLYESGFDLNSHDKLGFSAIHYASSLGFSGAVKYLLDLNVRMSNSAFNGETAINLELEEHKVGVYIGTA